MSQFNLSKNPVNSSTLIAMCALWCFSLVGCGDKPQVALGTLERHRVLLTATANEVIVEVYAREGQQVNEGDLLLRLNSARQEAVVAKASAEMDREEAALLRLTNGERPEDIASAQADVDLAQAAFARAETDFKRLDALLEQQLVSRSDWDAARARKDELFAALSSATEQYNKVIGGARHEDIVQAQASLGAARAEYAYQNQVLNDLTIVATRTGKLDTLPYNLGERVPLGAVVAAIQAGDAPYARVYLPEPYRTALSPGDERMVQVDGTDRLFRAELRWVATDPSFTPYYALNETDRARLMYVAEFDLDSEGIDLPTGVPVSVVLSRE
jgi:HlyD family secretion protein